MEDDTQQQPANASRMQPVWLLLTFQQSFRHMELFDSKHLRAGILLGRTMQLEKPSIHGSCFELMNQQVISSIPKNNSNMCTKPRTRCHGICDGPSCVMMVRITSDMRSLVSTPSHSSKRIPIIKKKKQSLVPALNASGLSKHQLQQYHSALYGSCVMPRRISIQILSQKGWCSRTASS